jgi:hypothetical protein
VHATTSITYACFMHRILVMSNAIQTIDNKMINLIKFHYLLFKLHSTYKINHRNSIYFHRSFSLGIVIELVPFLLEASARKPGERSAIASASFYHVTDLLDQVLLFVP